MQAQNAGVNLAEMVDHRAVKKLETKEEVQ